MPKVEPKVLFFRKSYMNDFQVQLDGAEFQSRDLDNYIP